MAWSMPPGPWNPGMAPDMNNYNMGSYTPEQWAMMQQQNWQQWTQWQQQYSQWQSQYGDKFPQQMQAMMGGYPVSSAIPPALPPPEKPPPPPPPHENDQPLYGKPKPNVTGNPPAPQTQPPPPPPQNTHTGYNNTTKTGNNQNQSYTTDTSEGVNTEALKKLAEEERLFDIQFKKWEEEIQKWKQDNVNHPDKQAYKEYEEKFEACRAQLLERRDQMKQKRARLTGNVAPVTNATNTGNISSAIPPLMKNTNYTQNVQPNTTQKPAQNYTKTSASVQYPPPQAPPPQYGTKPQQNSGHNRSNNRNIQTRDEHGSHQQMNEDRTSNQQTMNSDFLRKNQSKGIPGLDLVPEERNVSNKVQEVIDITGDNQTVNQQMPQAPDYSKISKGINNILGDEKIMNILSMMTNKGPVGKNTNQYIGGNMSNIANQNFSGNNQEMEQQWDRSNTNYSNNTYNNQQNMSYGQQTSNTYSNSQNQPPNINKPGFKNYSENRGFRQNDMPQEEQYDRKNNMPQGQNYNKQNNMSQGQFYDRQNNMSQQQPYNIQNQFGDQRPNQNQFGDQRPNQNQFGNQRPNQNQFANHRPNQNQFGNQRPNQNQFGDQRTNQNQFGDQRTNQNQFGNQRPNQNQFGDQMPNKNQHDDQRSNEKQYSEQRPDQNQKQSILPRPLMPNMKISDYSQPQGGFNQNALLENPKTEPAKPMWAHDPLFEPSIIVDYEHKPLRLKARDFIEPVHTFEYNHISKDGEGSSKQDFEREIDELFTRKSRRTREDDIDVDWNDERHYRRRPARQDDRGHSNVTREGSDFFNRRERYDRYEERRRDDRDRLARDDDGRSDFDRSRDRDFGRDRESLSFREKDPLPFKERSPLPYRDRETLSFRERDLGLDRDMGRDSRDRCRDRDVGRDRYFSRDRDADGDRDRDLGRELGHNSLRGRMANRDGDFGRDREKYSRDRKPDRNRSHSKDRDSRKREHSRDNDSLDSYSSKKSKTTKENTTNNTQTNNPDTPKHVVMIDDILEPPGRDMRPAKIIIILRGAPGSGKSYLAKLIRDKEAEYGGTVRIMSIDDYFMQETEVEEKDPATGKTIKKQCLKYEYDESSEETYINSLKRAFKRSITDGYFTFLIYDAINDQLKGYADVWNFGRQNGFQVYVCTMEMDRQICIKRNIHNRRTEDIEVIISRFYPTPDNQIQLDATTLLQSASITEVHMEDIDDVTMEDVDAEVEISFTSKWEKMEDATQLARLDGTSKPLRSSQLSMEDYLQLDEWTPNKAKPGKKTVRWADIEERREQEKMRAIGFVVGKTDWNRMTDPTMGSSALTQTKYIERVRK